MIKFRQKQFGVFDDTIGGAKVGAGIGTLATLLPFFRRGDGNKSNKWAENVSIIGAGTVVGAGLGLLVGLVRKASTTINRSGTVDHRLMQHVIDNLKRTGFKEGVDFTRDPKTANLMKTKVCIVITRESGRLELLVNTVSDHKLKETTDRLVKNIPNTATINSKLSDKYNDITISTISDSSADVGLITGIAENFIRNKYPVYLVEVG